MNAVALPYVFHGGKDLEIGVSMESSNELSGKRINMIDMVPDSSFTGNPLGLQIKPLNSFQVSPFWGLPLLVQLVLCVCGVAFCAALFALAIAFVDYFSGGNPALCFPVFSGGVGEGYFPFCGKPSFPETLHLALEIGFKPCAIVCAVPFWEIFPPRIHSHFGAFLAARLQAAFASGAFRKHDEWLHVSAGGAFLHGGILA